jgi:uncharacterized protein (DUF433 family)
VRSLCDRLIAPPINLLGTHQGLDNIANYSLCEMSKLLERITVNPKQCGGRPCVRGMRIRVSDVLDLFAAGLSAEEILEDLPDLEKEDIQASLMYAARKLNHPILVA